MEIKRIKAPKFRVGRHILNEYEFRQLQLEVALGIKPAGIKVKDSEGNESVILEHGSLSNNLQGLSIAIELKHLLLLANRNKGE